MLRVRYRTVRPPFKLESVKPEGTRKENPVSVRPPKPLKLPPTRPEVETTSDDYWNTYDIVIKLSTKIESQNLFVKGDTRFPEGHLTTHNQGSIPRNTSNIRGTPSPGVDRISDEVEVSGLVADQVSQVINNSLTKFAFFRVPIDLVLQLLKSSLDLCQGRPDCLLNPSLL